MKAPKPTQRYDVAVLGNALPGLVAAALLAQRGLRVLHVASVGAGLYESGGYRLPTGPDLFPSPKSVPAVRDTLDELALAAQIQRAMQPLQAQLLVPRARFEIDAIERVLGADAAQAFARAANTAEEHAAASQAPLLPQTLGERLRLWRHTAQNRAIFEAPLEVPEALRDLLLALHRFAAADEARPSALAFSRATAPLLAGIHRLPEGGLAAQLVGHVRARRGDALVAKVEQVVLERGRFAGLQIGGELWRARLFLAALPAAQLLPLLPDGRRAERLRTQSATAVQHRPLEVRNLVVASEGLPPALGSLALAAGFDGAPALFEVRPATRIDGTEDRSARVVTVTAAAGGEKLNALIEEVLPFHRDHLRHASDSPDPAPSLALLGHRKRGYEGLPVRTPIPGLLHAGPELLPSFGLEGGFLAGRTVAAAAQTIAGRDKP